MIEKNIDWDNLGFNAYKQKACLRPITHLPLVGKAEGLIPYGDVTLSPASTIFKLWAGYFEGTRSI